MISIIDDLAEFVEAGNLSDALSSINPTTDRIELRLVAIKLLGWLKNRAMFSHERPLELSKNAAWHSNLRALIANSAELSAVFCVSNDTLDFAQEVTPSERQSIVDFADKHYHPPLRT